MMRNRIVKVLIIVTIFVVFGSVLLIRSSNSGPISGFGVGEYKNFRVVEEGDSLIFYSKDNKRLLTLSENGSIKIGNHTVEISPSRIDMGSGDITLGNANQGQIYWDDTNNRLVIKVS